MGKKVGILFTSRNNYALLDNWVKKVDIEECEVLSIDEDSTEDNKKNGKEICSQRGIVYMDREERGMQNNIVTACNYFESRGVEWLIWFQHDCFPLNENFFTKFIKFIFIFPQHIMSINKPEIFLKPRIKKKRI